MIHVDVNKRVVCPWSVATVKKILGCVEQITKSSGHVEINIVGDTEIKKLNFRYRGLNKVTDVLSFAWQEETVVPSKSLGQIYICYPHIVRQAKKFNVTANEEFVRMLAHGFLHIIGHDHNKKKEAKIMFDLQEKIVDKYFSH